ICEGRGVKFPPATRPHAASVLEGARKVAVGSRVPYGVYESDTGMNHLDPLFAATDHNTATRSLAEFLRTESSAAH
ncbi:hypothetical protein ACWDEW_48030, partial [Streptomyces sp. NPDC001100]